MSDLSNQDLQIKLAFLERHIEEQDKVIHLLRNALDKLENRLRRIEERSSDNTPGAGPTPADERPPHY